MTELTINKALQKGIEAHKAGQVQEADRLYTAIMKIQPKHPDANHNMGVLAVGVGKVEQALPFFKTALEANAAIAQFWLSYIDALIKLERLPEAQAVLDQATSKGIKGDSFDKLAQRLKDATKEYPTDTTIVKTLETNQHSTLDKAIQLRETGEFNQAIGLLKDKINQFPENVDMLALLSHCHLLKDQLDEATFYLDKAKKIAPENASVCWNVVRLMLKEQKNLEALSVARDTSQRFPNDVEGLGVLGACLRANEEITEALFVLNRAIELNANYAEAWIHRGLIRLSQNNKPQALADLQTAHELKPHIKHIWDLVIGLNAAKEDFSTAILLLINMITIDPNNEKFISLLISFNQKANDNALAVKSFERILEVKPGNASMHINLGIALAKQGEPTKAIDSFKAAITIKPDFADAYYNLGNAYQHQGELEEAINNFKKAVAIKPDYADAYYNLGNTFRHKGKLKEAIEAYEKVLTITPDYAEAYNNMGNALQEYGKLEEALVSYNRALAIKPDYAETCNNMGNVLRKQDKLKKSIEAYNKAITIQPDYAEAFNNMGITFKDQGKLEDSIEAYKKALAIKPDHAGAYSNMGVTLQEQGKLKEAIETYNKALAIKPDHGEAASNLVKIPLGCIDAKTVELLNDSRELLCANIKDHSQRLFFEAKLLAHNGKLKDAFELIVAANKVKWRQVSSSVVSSEKTYNTVITRISDWSPKLKPINKSSLKTLIILGPSRSGKSTLEDILAFNPNVCPMFENIDLNDLNDRNPLGNNNETLNMGRIFHHDEKALLSAGYDMVTSTAPETIFQIDRLMDRLSNCFVVLVKRNREDLASEIFATEYRSGNFYSYDNSSILAFLQTYEAIWKILRQKVPHRTLEVSFEDVLIKPQEVLEGIDKISSINFLAEYTSNSLIKNVEAPFKKFYQKHFK